MPTPTIPTQHSPRILVTGAPGNVGSEIVKGLIGTVPFRIGTFQLDKARQVFGEGENSSVENGSVENGFEYVHFDFLNPATFAPTFAGIEKMFLVRPPALANVKRDIAPALIAARQAGVKHIVFLSLQGVEKNRVVPHHKIEKLIRELGFTYTFLRASFFMQNLSTTHRAEICERGEIAVPVGNAPTSFIDVRDIAAVAVRALTERGHENKIYTLTGSEALTYAQVSEVMSAELGRPIHYTNPSVFEFIRRQLAEGRKFGMALVMAALYMITRFGNAKEVTNDVQNVLGRSPIRFQQFVADNRMCWLPLNKRLG